jgi:N utilization substance protein A
VEIFDEEESAEVIVPDDQVSLAIGKNGQNVRLAAKLTGWHIDIRKESDKFELEMRAIEEDRQAAIREILDGGIDVLPLRKTALEALKGAGLESVHDVLEMGPDGLLTVKGFGEQALKNVETFLVREGITFEDWRELIGDAEGAEEETTEEPVVKVIDAVPGEMVYTGIGEETEGERDDVIESASEAVAGDADDVAHVEDTDSPGAETAEGEEGKDKDIPSEVDEERTEDETIDR